MARCIDTSKELECLVDYKAVLHNIVMLTTLAT